MMCIYGTILQHTFPDNFAAMSGHAPRGHHFRLVCYCAIKLEEKDRGMDSGGALDSIKWTKDDIWSKKVIGSSRLCLFAPLSHRCVPTTVAVSSLLDFA